MSAVEVRTLGTTATFAPVMKRATAHLSTGQSVLVVPDMNLVGAQGSDVSGTAKFIIYVSTDSARTAYTSFSYTPGVAPMLVAKSAICSVARSSFDNKLLVAYQGVDNSVRLITFAWSGTAYTGGTEQTIIAASAVTNRIRAIDIDDSGPTVLNPAVVVYESLASNGQGAYVRAYIRKDDQTTWIKVWEEQIFTSQFINAGSEDVSIAWDASGIATNVNRLAIYYTRNHTTGDLGDKIVEVSVNVNTATANSGTLVGTWFSTLNQNIAAGTRRGWLFSEASGVWMFATAVGSTSPFFMAARLYHNTFTGIVQNKTVQTQATQAQPTNVFNIVRQIFPQAAVACSFSDGRVMFTYSGLGLLVSYTTRSMVIRFSTVTSTTSALSIDTAPRIFDLGYALNDGVIGVYGGDNKRVSVGDFQFNVLAFYGSKGVSLNAINNDNFDRTVASGFGTSTSGFAWSVIGTASNYAANGVAGTMSTAAVNTIYRAVTTAGPSAADTVQYVDVTMPVLVTGATISVGLVCRYQNSSNYYELLVNFVVAANAIQLAFQKVVAGATTAIGAPVASGLTHVAGTTYRIKLLNVGTQLTASIWNPSGVEPAGMNNQTDASLTVAGQQGMGCQRNTSNSNGVQTITFDNYAYFAAAQSISRKARAVIEDAPSAPSILAPTNTVVAKNTLDIRVQAQNINIYSNVLGKAEVQLASDAGFTTNLRTITQADADYASLSATTGTTPPIKVITLTASGASALFTGAWYLRARIVDDLGGASPYSSTVNFTVSHPPTALPISPAPSSSLLYGTGDVTFSWTFGDSEPTDTQSAYQVLVTRLDTGAIVWDSGKILSSAKFATNNFAVGLKDVPMQWTVSLWDSGNSQGPLSTPGMFTVMDPPTVAITAPTGGGTVTTALPTITWNFTAGGTRIQRGYRVLIYNTDASPDVVVADTGMLMGSAVSYTFATQILAEGVNYQVYVYVQDTVGLMANDNELFITDWIPPAQAVATTSSTDNFKVTVSWTNATQDANWVSWRVYRRYMIPAIVDLDLLDTANVWTLMDEQFASPASMTFLDYLAPLNRPVQYAVVQLADRFGSLIESDISSITTVTLNADRYYFVPEVPIGTIASFEAANVTADGFAKEVEQAVIHVKGRGRQVQIGDDLGYTGSLTVQLRNPATARRDREFFEFLSSDDAGNVYIRSPFGDVLYVAFGNISTNRIPGMGLGDMADLTVPYLVVFGTLPITRDS